MSFKEKEQESIITRLRNQILIVAVAMGGAALGMNVIFITTIKSDIKVILSNQEKFQDKTECRIHELEIKSYTSK